MMRAVNRLAAGLSKSHIHLGTEEADSPRALSKAASNTNLATVAEVDNSLKLETLDNHLVKPESKNKGPSEPGI
jgi:hypothetical protein